jgi:hypothetical protein
MKRKDWLEMDQMKFKLSALWTATMFSYQLADILRIYSGDYAAGGEVFGSTPTQALWLASSVYMVVPAIMIVLSLFLPHKANRWTSIILAPFFFAVNLFALTGYESGYDIFLAIVGLVFNVMVFWLALKWKNTEAKADLHWGAR